MRKAILKIPRMVGIPKAPRNNLLLRISRLWEDAVGFVLGLALLALSLAFLAAVAASAYYYGALETIALVALLFIAGWVAEIHRSIVNPSIQALMLKSLSPGNHLVSFDYGYWSRAGIVQIRPIDGVYVVLWPEDGEDHLTFHRIVENSLDPAYDLHDPIRLYGMDEEMEKSEEAIKGRKWLNYMFDFDRLSYGEIEATIRCKTK